MATTTTPLPTVESLRRLLSGILGSPITVKKRTPVNPKLAKPTVSAVYHDDGGQVSAVCACDLELGASLGAAMTMIPARVAEEMVARKKVDEMVYDNLREIMNVMASSFNAQTNVHVRLVDVRRTPGEKLDEASAALVAQAAGKADFEVDVPRYGTGHVSLYVA